MMASQCVSQHTFLLLGFYIMLFEFWFDANMEKYIPRRKDDDVRTFFFICQLGDFLRRQVVIHFSVYTST